MNIDQYMQSLNNMECPDDLSPYLQALWYESKGNWNKAHHIIQNIDDKKAARIHAYLHRKEGDLKNAVYWHNRADSTLPEDLSLEQEWQFLVHSMIS